MVSRDRLLIVGVTLAIMSSVLLFIAIFGGLHKDSQQTDQDTAPNLTTPQKDSVFTPPDAEARRAGNGSDAPEVAPGVTLISGWEYRYNATYGGQSGVFTLDVQKANQPEGNLILELEFQTANQTYEETVYGKNITQSIRAADDKRLRMFLSMMVTVPYGERLNISNETTVGDRWEFNHSGETVSVEVTGEKTIAKVDCQSISVTRGEDKLYDLCYSPSKQVITHVTKYGDGEKTYTLTLVNSQY